MRAFIILAALILHGAIRPEYEPTDETIKVTGWVVIIAFIMDVAELFIT